VEKEYAELDRKIDGMLGRVGAIFRFFVFIAVVAAVWFVAKRLSLESQYGHDAEIGSRLVDEGSYSEAIPHLQESLDAARQLGSRDTRLDKALQVLADAYGAKGDYVESQHLYFASFQNRIANHGFAHPETADVLFKLGRSYELQNLPEVAEGMYNQAIAAWQQMNRPDDPEATAAYLGLARVLAKLRRYDAAIASHAKAVGIQEKVLGAGDPKLTPLLEAYAGLLEAGGRTADAASVRERAQHLPATPVASADDIAPPETTPQSPSPSTEPAATPTAVGG